MEHRLDGASGILDENGYETITFPVDLDEQIALANGTQIVPVSDEVEAPAAILA